VAVPDPQVLLLLGSGLTLLLALAVLVNLYPKLGLGLFILLAALWTNLRTPVAATLPLGELELSALDLLTVVMLGCGIFRALTARSPGRRLWPVWLLLAVMLVNVARGLSEHGLQRTGDEVRSWLYLLSIILFSATVAVTDARWWRRVASAYVGVLVVIALIGLAGTGLGAATTTVNLDGKLVDPRPLSSFGALVLADALLFLLGRRLHGRGGSLTAVAVLVATLVVLQQRTVWIAAAVACAYLGYLALRAGGRARLAASVGAALASVVAVGDAVLREMLKMQEVAS